MVSHNTSLGHGDNLRIDLIPGQWEMLTSDDDMTGMMVGTHQTLAGPVTLLPYCCICFPVGN